MVGPLTALHFPVLLRTKSFCDWLCALKGNLEEILKELKAFTFR
jgi:hypothetical protein